ncbi:sulfatase-like hydrolase/transferase [Marinobacter sp.]|uniref:sulfatase-like hydrolase/transferase n=1 Tax=Marinobacter sp. TaxID=50741 RepID=UPI0034A15D4A
MMKSSLFLALALNLMLVALTLPGTAYTPWLALETLFLWGIFTALPPGTGQRKLVLAAGVTYALLAALTAVDILVQQSLGRPLNLYLELGVAGAAYHLLETNLGVVLAVAVLVLLLTTLMAMGTLFAFLLQRLARHSTSHAPKVLLSAAIVVTGVTLALPTPIAATGAAMLGRQVALAADTHTATRAFQAAIKNDQSAGTTALKGLTGKDVILGFVESYGISSITDPRYSQLIRSCLNEMENTLAERGLHLVSGRLTSPVQGGQSWLAHMTLLSGQWVDSQLDYDILLSSRHTTLIDDMKQTGHKTVAVMPAITRAWPEGRRFGYDRIYDASTMGYQGPPFNWVTMPDQYTWSWFEQELRANAQQPLFAEMALISSHAPWVPILPVLSDWDQIGNGEVFKAWSDSGEAPASLWRDPDRVREHYGRAINYALEVITGYAARHVDSNTLLIIVGDHQPAPLITGDNASRDAIVHIISADRSLISPFLDAELPGFQAGAIPDLTANGLPMDRFRSTLQSLFSRG